MLAAAHGCTSALLPSTGMATFQAGCLLAEHESPVPISPPQKRAEQPWWQHPSGAASLGATLAALQVMLLLSRSHVLQAGAQPGSQDIQPVSCWVTICRAGWPWLGCAMGKPCCVCHILGDMLIAQPGSMGLALASRMPTALLVCWRCPAPHWSQGSLPATTVSPQLESKAGKGIAERALPDWKVALKREREEHQHLLAESYSAVMDLTKQLQISEKNWNQEKVELLARFKEEQQQAEQQAKELQNKLNQVW